MVKKLTILVPDELHSRLKERSYKNGITMARIVINSIKEQDPSSKIVDAKKLERITSVEMDEYGAFTKIPAHIVEKLRLKEGDRVYLSRWKGRKTGERTIHVDIIEPALKSEHIYHAYVKSKKDGEYLASISSSTVEKLGLKSQDNVRLQWCHGKPSVWLRYVKEGEDSAQ
jgi:hypothetical protein